MGKLVDLMGMVFSRLTVIRKDGASRAAGANWICVCDCGTEISANSLKLRDGHTKSCGCLRAEGTANLIHGDANRTKTYRSWKEMRQRCNNPNSTQWKWYGGRGIKVCDEWGSFEQFRADMGERGEGLTIDRVNPDGNYEPSNCRWATAKEQAITNRGVIRKGAVPVNKTTEADLAEMRRLRAQGAKLAEIAEKFGKNMSVVSDLINYGGRKGKQR